MFWHKNESTMFCSVCTRWISAWNTLVRFDMRLLLQHKMRQNSRKLRAAAKLRKLTKNAAICGTRPKMRTCGKKWKSRKNCGPQDRDFLQGLDKSIISRPVWVRSIAISVYVCLSARIPQKSHVQISQYFLYMLPVSVARSYSRRQCNTLCTSGFADDVMFIASWPMNPQSWTKAVEWRL